MRLTRTAAPVGHAITSTEVKAYCRVDSADEDTLIKSLIGAVHDYLDGPSGILGRAILQQTWRLELTAWPHRLLLPIEPVSAVAVSWLDAEGTATTLPADSYHLITSPSAQPVIVWKADAALPQLSGQLFPVRIDITAGEADAASVDDGLKTAMIMLAGHWYDHRAAVVSQGTAELPFALSSLLARYRRHL